MRRLIYSSRAMVDFSPDHLVQRPEGDAEALDPLVNPDLITHGGVAPTLIGLYARNAVR